MANLGPTELLIIAAVVLVLFGSKKLPDAARSMGRSMRIFKSETSGLRHDDQAEEHDEAAKQQRSAEGQATQLTAGTAKHAPPASDSATTQRDA